MARHLWQVLSGPILETLLYRAFCYESSMGESMRELRTDDQGQIGVYRLTGLLGEGGQGSVYRGEAPDGSSVAVKLLHARFGGDAKARSRFAAELSHAQRVAPFCTARVLDADLEGDQPYIVSEFVDGPSLAEAIATAGPSHGPTLDRIAIATVTALAAIHEAGIVHRDFKPNNVIMGADGPRVIDFGIARALDATGTLSSAIIGTPAYMAPEQIAGGAIGPAADIFAWACTVAYAASGAAPFGRDSIPTVMHRILNEEPDLRGLTGPLRDLVSACLAKDAADRPTAREVLLGLLGGNASAGAARTLLDEGAQAASPSPASPDAQSRDQHGPPHEMPPADAPTRPVGPREQKPLRITRRKVTRSMALTALLLGLLTALPWGRIVQTGLLLSNTVHDDPVAGVRTIWGILTAVMAVTALCIAINDELARRISAVWAAVPGALAVASITTFMIRKADLVWMSTHTDATTHAQMREMGFDITSSLSVAVYIALAMAIAVTALALVSRRFPESTPAQPSRRNKPRRLLKPSQ
ncbi:serine/threonine-protein kinase [Spirillospora sp. NPDC046719]